ncbi:uncharacterized protein CANTADRAFT_35455, partial [Suhomyces tanzawaensis NRRL Y-17324]
WYRHTTYRDDDDDDDDAKLVQPPLDMDLAGASTPLANRSKMSGVSSSQSPNISISFMSPISKLDNLHLESEDHDGEFSLGDKTITNDTDSENDGENDRDSDNDSELQFKDESHDDNDHRDGMASSPPVYINYRKRQHIESPVVAILTPKTPSVNNDPDAHMSICNTSSASSLHKLSFSNSDSTPCPVQPKRKKLKFKNTHDTTPSTRNPSKKLLNLSHSMKTDVNSIISQLHAHQPEDEDEDLGSSSPPASGGLSGTQLQSTPISQSTPANLRSSTPPGMATQEYGEPVNGYKFVKPVGKPHPQYTYQTPVSSHPSTDLRQAYTRNDYTPISNKYEIVGEFPVTSAGLMDESNGDIHIGDKRINDPYLKSNSSFASTPTSIPSEFRDQYMASTRLPIEPEFYDVQESLTVVQLLELVSDKTKLGQFYTHIQLAQEPVLELLKAERIRWHPDKWTSRLRDSSMPLHFNTQVLDRLSQVLNELIEDYR